MFDEQANQLSQTQSSNDQTTASSTPAFGLGGNPNPTFGDVTPAANSTSPATSVPVSSTPSQPPVLPTTSPQSTSPSDDLQDIKNQALAQLSPLVSQLDQTPEEKYKTIMMMIQASDNQSLIGEAYAAAQQITDEKVKAEALLNIVNEINYFTQQKS